MKVGYSSIYRCTIASGLVLRTFWKLGFTKNDPLEKIPLKNVRCEKYPL